MRGLFFGSLFVLGLGLSACGANIAERRAPAPPDTLRPLAAERELCLVAGHGAWQLDLHFGDPTRSPPHVYFWVAGRPGRLGLDAAPADTADLRLPPPLLFGAAPPPILATSQWLSVEPVRDP
jgi:hypothetical protein